jgi:S-adenosylmethionine uptake transporter
VLGFCGVLIALQPSSASLSWPAIFALGGSAAFGLTLILGRRLRGTSDTTLVTWQTLAALMVGGIMSFTTWQTPSAPEFGAMLLLGVVSCIAHLLITRSLKLAPASLLAPLQYSMLVWGILFGFIFFDDVPSQHMLIGAVIIVLAGLFIFHRQKVVAEVPPETVPKDMV